jgi:hypothetical protein
MRPIFESITIVEDREEMGDSFIPVYFRDAAANVLTIDKMTATARSPSSRSAPVQIEPLGALRRSEP